MDVIDGKLEIFEFFHADDRLPKAAWKRELEKSNVVTSEAASEAADTSPAIPFRGSVIANPIVSHSAHRFRSQSRMDRIAEWFVDFFKKATRRQLTVEQVFSSIKDSAEQISVVKERAAGFHEMLRQAEKAGQTSLCEKIMDAIDAVRSETQLIAIGKTKFITEEAVVSVSKKSPRAIKLDWVANFVRPIPEDVLQVKAECDERRIFDNYAVMHFDPRDTGSEMTKVQKEDARDPILFGLIAGSRKLYFVGDWVDEKCDLTLDKIAEIAGSTAIQQIPMDIDKIR